MNYTFHLPLSASIAVKFDPEYASKRPRLNDRSSLADIRFLLELADKGAEVSIGKVEAKEGAGTRIGRPIFVPYRSAQFTLRDDDKQAFSIGRERKYGEERERDRELERVREDFRVKFFAI